MYIEEYMMKKINNVLVVFEDIKKNKHVIQKCLELASIQNANLHFIKIVDSFNQIRTNLPNLSSSKKANIHKFILREMEEQIFSTFNINTELVPVTFDVQEGIGFIKIIQEVNRYKHDIVIIGESKSEYPRLRSNTLQLIRNCPCPVWIIRNAKSLLKLRILIAVDSDQSSKTRKNVNNICVSLIELIFNNKNPQVQIIHAWRLKNEEWLRMCPNLDIPYHQIDEMVANEKKNHQEWFKSFLEKSKHLAIKKSIFIEGRSTEIIPEIVKKNKIDLLIMGTLSLTQVPGLLMTNKAETILQKIPCSIITVKPDGFVSPIK